MEKIPFIKMHGLGNDFVIIDERATNYSLMPKMVQDISSRNRGVGCDQLVVLKKSDNADCFVVFYNADGSRSGACGNATRCVASLIMQETNKKNVTLQTEAGILSCADAAEFGITVNMGKARTSWQEIPLAREADTLHVGIGEGELSDPVAVSMGNPHAVFFVKNTAAVDFGTLGPKLEHHEIFPQRANIGVAEIISKSAIKLRVWERGTGETEACGTGACAAAFAAYSRGLTNNDVVVSLPGGDLRIQIGDDNNVMMTGGATLVFKGEIDSGIFE
jgi:diaminopimelate epimerase